MMAVSAPAGNNSKFAGDIPEFYDRKLVPLLFEPYAVDLAKRVARLKPRKVLEVAAGTGVATRRLLDVLPRDCAVTATDLNEPMLDQARLRVGRDPRVTFRQADALNLPFDDGAFDAVVCQFGLMFFPDKPQGMHEFHRVLSKSGHLLLNVWDSLRTNPPARTANDVIGEFFSEDPPRFWNIPYGCHDVKELRRLANAAGFASIDIVTLPIEGISPSAKDAAEGLVRGTPIANSILERAPKKIDEIVRRTRECLAAEYGASPLRIPLQAHVLTATKPTA
jgi:ubiquinone/menaquinone biosynthesis C-methylase UbiE